MRHIAFINGIIKAGDKVIIEPNVFYNIQNKASALNGGFILNYKLGTYIENELISGIYYRNQDAIIPMFGFKYNQTRVIFSYDVTVSTLKKFNNSAGASEISIIYKGFYKDHTDRQVICPRF